MGKVPVTIMTRGSLLEKSYAAAKKSLSVHRGKVLLVLRRKEQPEYLAAAKLFVLNLFLLCKRTVFCTVLLKSL